MTTSAYTVSGRTREQWVRSIAALLATTALLTACATTDTSTQADGSSAAPPPTSQNRPTTTEATVDAGDLADHVHNLVLDGGSLMLGTHQGLFRQDPGQSPTQVSADRFDVMGLARAGNRWLASGHPGEGMQAPADLGLLASVDQGRTWTSQSLSGEVDFHRLAASGGTVIGLSAHDGALMRSDDGGDTWVDLGTPPLYDVAVSPVNPRTVVATTADGPVTSDDGGQSFTPLDNAPLLALLAWSEDALYGAGPDGTMYASDDDGRTWTQGASVDGVPMGLTAAGDQVAVLAGTTVYYSTDRGRTFEPRITGVGGH